MPRVQAHELTAITDADLQSDEPQYGPSSLPTRGAASRQRGDVIDQLATRRNGTLPARDAAITRPYTESDFPDQSRTVGGGFWGNDTHGFQGAFAPILHPLDTLDRSLDAAQRIGTNEVPAPSGHDALRDLSTATLGTAPTAVPVMWKDTWDESTARNMRGESTSDLYGGAAGMAAQAGIGKGLSKIPVRTLATAAGRKVGALPAEYMPDEINRAIGSGAVDTQRRVDVGRALAESGVDIDPAAVKANPRALVDHVQQVLDRENLAADQLLQSPEAQRPTAIGSALLRGVKNTALLTDADRAAAASVRTYVAQKIDELSQKHGGNGAISIADADVIKRELQSRANYDKIFGNTALTTTDTLRNQLLSDYAARFDKLGDTLPGYADLNQRRSSLIHYRDNVLYPSVDNAITGTTVPSRAGAGIRTAANAVRGNIPGVVAGVNDLVASRTPAVDPFRIATAIQRQVSAARAAGIQSPTAQILAAAEPTILDTPAASSIPSRAQFAAGTEGGALPTSGTLPASPGFADIGGKWTGIGPPHQSPLAGDFLAASNTHSPTGRPGAVPAAMPPTGPSAFSTALEPATDRAANATAATSRMRDALRPPRPAPLSSYKALPARSSPSVQPSSGVVFAADTPNNPAFWRERTGVTPRGTEPARSGPVRADHIDRAATTRADLDRVIAEHKVDAPFRAARTEVRPNRSIPTPSPEVSRIQFGKDGRMLRPSSASSSGASELPARPAAPAVNPNSYEGVQASFDKRNALVGDEAQRNTDVRPTRSASASSIPQRTTKEIFSDIRAQETKVSAARDAKLTADRALSAESPNIHLTGGRRPKNAVTVQGAPPQRFVTKAGAAAIEDEMTGAQRAAHTTEQKKLDDLRTEFDTAAHAEAAAAATTEATAPFEVKEGNEVRFSIGNARRHGRVTKLVPSKAGPAVEIQTPDRGTFTVLVSKLTRLDRPSAPPADANPTSVPASTRPDRPLPLTRDQAEWSFAKGYDSKFKRAATENDALLDSTPYADLLPNRFKNAKKVTGMSWAEDDEASGDAFDRHPAGLYNVPAEPLEHEHAGAMDLLNNDHPLSNQTTDKNNIHTARRVSTGGKLDNHIALHEIGHAVGVKDLTDAEYKEWQQLHLRLAHEASAYEDQLEKTQPDAAWKDGKKHDWTPNYQKVLDRYPIFAHYSGDWDESFADAFSAYIASPRALQKRYPNDVYPLMKKFFRGREYTQPTRPSKSK